jgi:aminopeptidase
MPDAAQVAAYAELTVRVGLNVQPGQDVLVTGFGAGVALDCAPFVRRVVECCYDAGARRVRVLWDDDAVRRTSLQRMAAEAVTEVDEWEVAPYNESAAAGAALLSIDGDDPAVFAGIADGRASAREAVLADRTREQSRLVGQLAMNWSIVTVPTAGWAATALPELAGDEALERLWTGVLHAVRADLADPVAAWRYHVDDLARRSAYLTGRSFRSLRITGGGTDLTVGLPDGHRWLGGAAVARNGVTFVPNLPTEEVFTAPHRGRTDGVVLGTQPVLVRGEMVEGWRLVFRDGVVVEASAEQGEAALRALIAADAGSERLGEVALVAESSPTREAGLRFGKTIFEENLSSHVALGSAYPPCIDGAGDVDDEGLAALGGNASQEHADVMWGSAAVDVDGVRPDGSHEPLLRGGAWAFSA